MDWNLKALEQRLSGELFGRRIHYFSETTSTNDEAFSLGLKGEPEGTAVIADGQSSGRGRLQRSWHSPSGVNIYTSIILRPGVMSSEASRIPVMAGVAVADVLEPYCRGKISLKWPNDVLINDKKVCGILSQAKLNGRKIDFIVLGTGINVNVEKHQFPEEIRGFATSLKMETNTVISRQELIISLYANIEKWYKQLSQEGFAPIKKRWLELAPMIGRAVQVIFKSEKLEGMASGLDDDGALILETARKEQVKVSAGDATIMKR